MTDSSIPLTPLLSASFAARADLMARLHAEDTNAHRLFHGSVEGESGLAIDRYGDLLLVQSFHRALDPAQLKEIAAFYATVMPGLDLIYNDRSQANSRIGNPLSPEDLARASVPREIREMGVRYLVQGRHAGQDPWLFLDMRAGRRRVMKEAPDKSLLNLFAYTCGVGVAAAKAGASFVVNVDFSKSSLDVGKENARINEMPHRPRFIKSDAFAVMRQYAGIGQPQTVRGKRMPHSTHSRADRKSASKLRPECINRGNHGGYPARCACSQKRLIRLASGLDSPVTAPKFM